MKTPDQRIRAMVDKLNKRQAMRPAYPTGGDNRATGEAINTGANARNLAMMQSKVGKVAQTVPLAELIRKAR
jgi:hypothetical protein